uniref:60S ribosomal protein L31 n=1 Tax=Palpitomonas bilix TaxID=652834 RepID=A0A7S3CYZ3_9EUKA|mmetsp:Transcript_15084/g.38120  ORF Transcript_15084/g.38120 Transcript_15084/m.38120 type:complete len:120 (+) Transcript_15084:251-610(+)
MVKVAKKDRVRSPDVITRDYTVNLHKALHGIGFKRRAPRAVKAIREFAQKMMKTNDVRVDTEVNKFVWHKGVKAVPYRVRVRLSRRKNDDEDAKESLYTHVQLVEVSGFKGLNTEKVDA